MRKDDCRCRFKGRLIIEIESAFTKEVKVILLEGNHYRDVYRVPIINNRGKLCVDHISMGVLTVDSDLQEESTIYYPQKQFLFNEQNYVYKVTIFDRRKKDEM